MWICIIVVISLGRAHPFTTIQPEKETEAPDAAEITMSSEFANVSSKVANVSSEVGNVSSEVGNESSEVGNESSKVANMSSKVANVSSEVGNMSSKVANATVHINATDSPEPQSKDFSYMVAILHKSNFLLGAGAVMGKRWVLVTAFQMGAFKADQLNVRVGSPSAVSGGQLLAVSEVFLHPMFKKFNNDIALLKTKEDIELSGSVRSIPIAEVSPDIGESAVLWTWGIDSTAESNRADILPASDCRAFYTHIDLTDGNICAVLDHVLPYYVGLYGSPLVYNGSLVGLYMGMEANVFKPSLCSNLPPIAGWVHAMMRNETATQLLFPL